MQQPFNEVVATIVAECLGISLVPYTLLWDDKTPYSVSAHLGNLIVRSKVQHPENNIIMYRGDPERFASVRFEGRTSFWSNRNRQISSEVCRFLKRNHSEK